MRDANTLIQFIVKGAFRAALKTKLRSAALLAGVFLFPVVSSTQSALPIDAFFRTQNAIARSWGECFQKLQENEHAFMSPYGPTYWDEFMLCWESSNISGDFRKLEVHIRQIAVQIDQIRDQHIERR